MLSELGAVSISNEVLQRHYQGESLSIEDQEIMANVPKTSAALLEKIPLLENVSVMIEKQTEYFDFSQVTTKLNRDLRVLLGGHMIKCVREFDRLLQSGYTPADARKEMLSKPMLFKQELVTSLSQYQGGRTNKPQLVLLEDLKVGMVLDSDICQGDYSLILPKGFAVTETTLLTTQANMSHIEGHADVFTVVQHNPPES